MYLLIGHFDIVLILGLASRAYVTVQEVGRQPGGNRLWNAK
jgi:hypothetical protein